VTALAVRCEEPGDRRARASELYRAGRSLHAIADELGVTERSVYRYLRADAVLPRRKPAAGSGRPRRRRRRVAVERHAPFERAAIAFTADRGWHMTEAPPGWFLDLLAELD
jgi:predicted ArsR family transcriptional regulator